MDPARDATGWSTATAKELVVIETPSHLEVWNCKSFGGIFSLLFSIISYFTILKKSITRHLSVPDKLPTGIIWGRGAEIDKN